MSGAGIALQLASSAMSAGSQNSASQAAAAVGIGQQQAALYSAGIANQRATQAMAAGASQAGVVAANRGFILGSQRSAAASGGGTATSPTPMALMGNTRARIEYNQLSDVYGGSVESQGLRNQATLDIFQGQQELTAANAKAQALRIQAATTALSGLGNVAAKYGSFSSSSGASLGAQFKSPTSLG